MKFENPEDFLNPVIGVITVRNKCIECYIGQHLNVVFCICTECVL